MADVAREHARTPRFVQQAVQAGDLPVLRMVGRTAVIDDVAVTAWARSLARGRRWTPAVREAAFDLLSTGQSSWLSSSERSRLRSRLRTMPAQAIAHAAGGLAGEWARYRTSDVGGLTPIGPSAVDAASLHLVPGSGWVTFVEVNDLDRFEYQRDVIVDADGNLGVVRRDHDPREARVLADCYLLGDARLSAAAAAELEGRARGL
ncbi:MAG: hypothetical protein ACK5LN_03225 [Propioniciclava sp.]